MFPHSRPTHPVTDMHLLICGVLYFFGSGVVRKKSQRTAFAIPVRSFPLWYCGIKRVYHFKFSFTHVPHTQSWVCVSPSAGFGFFQNCYLCFVPPFPTMTNNAVSISECFMFLSSCSYYSVEFMSFFMIVNSSSYLAFPLKFKTPVL